jgi:hypothetical protein
VGLGLVRAICQTGPPCTLQTISRATLKNSIVSMQICGKEWKFYV